MLEVGEGERAAGVPGPEPVQQPELVVAMPESPGRGTPASVQDVATMAGVSVEWLRSGVASGVVDCTAEIGNELIWTRSDADIAVAQIAKLREAEMALEAPKKEEEEPMRQKKARRLPRGQVSISTLAKRLGVHNGTIHSWIRNGHIPAGVRTHARRYWTKKEATAIEERVAEYRGRLERFSEGFRQNPNKSWSCPAGCGFKTTSAGGILSHLRACVRVWDGPARKVVAPAVASRDIPLPAVTVSTRMSLLAIAADVLDGKATLKEFTEQVIAYRIKVKTVREELERLLGK